MAVVTLLLNIRLHTPTMIISVIIYRNLMVRKLKKLKSQNLSSFYRELHTWQILQTVLI